MAIVPQGIVPVVPVYPDFHVCDREYGTNLILADCPRAADNLPINSQIVSFFHVNNQPPPRILTDSVHFTDHG